MHCNLIELQLKYIQRNKTLHNNMKRYLKSSECMVKHDKTYLMCLKHILSISLIVFHCLAKIRRKCMRKFYFVVVLIIGVMLMSACAKEDPVRESNLDVDQNDQTESSAEIYVFHAASLSNVMNKIQEMYQQVAPNVTMILNSDSSGTLQKQIEEGAECDIFFSAAMSKMAALDEGGYIEADSIHKLLENKVVLIKPIGVETKVTGFENVYLASSLALAGEDVPAGAYGRQIFKNLGVWDQVEAMEVNEGANVTAVLTSVSEASNEVGIVYATDANSMKDSVEILATAPEDSLDTPIVYPVGHVKNIEADEAQYQAAEDFLTYLSSEDVVSTFEEFGFSIYQE